MSSALERYKKNYRFQDVGDKQITEIVLKAEVGICMLARALYAALPVIEVKPRKLVITTTKMCSESCIKTLSNWAGMSGVVIENETLTHFNITNKTLRTSLKNRAQVSVVSGIDWKGNSIPETESSLKSVARSFLPMEHTTGEYQQSSRTTTCIIQ